MKKGFEVVVYDNEPNNGSFSTPPGELIDPAKSTNEAVQLIRDAGLESGIAPLGSFLLLVYQGVAWTNVDLLILQFQDGQTEQIILATNLISDYVRQEGDTEIFLQVNPIFAEISVIGDRVKAVRDKIDGVVIICLEIQDCNSNMFSSLLTELGR